MRILYIHGFGGSKNGNSAKLLHNHLKKVIDVEFIAPQMHNNLDFFEKNVHKIKSLYTKYQPDLIIASSYGAMCTMIAKIKSVPQILINPCLNPLEIFPAITNITETNLAQLEIANFLLEKLNLCDDNVHYIISLYDELFGTEQVQYGITYLKNHGVTQIETINSHSHKIIPSMIDKYVVNIFKNIIESLQI